MTSRQLLSDELNGLFASLKQLQGDIAVIKSNPTAQNLAPGTVETLTAKLSELSLTSEALVTELSVLDSLHYDRRLARHEMIATAHQRTFEWVFKCYASRDNAKGRFTEWLEEGCGFFWITGKPGSGKSTLLKYIANHGRMKSHLLQWASPLPLIFAQHYFWSAGTAIERSHEGLLRSILYDILGAVPSLIHVVCEDRCKKGATNILRQHPWSMAELRSVLQNLARQRDIPFKCCILIDGLDEFDGDHMDLCQALLDLCQSDRIKLCISSRPWNVFLKSFGCDDQRLLHVHELTRHDIKRFASDRLADLPRAIVSQLSKDDVMWLVKEITDMAEGVFLWVFLVTRTLRMGLTNGDTFTDLQRRLKSIPTDLEQFLRAILMSVDDFYHEKMAGFLRIALAADGPLDRIVYAFHDLEYEDENYAMWSINERQPTDIDALVGPVASRVNARCMGLLEVKGTRVEFLHRTVRDFLQTGEMNEFLVSKSRSNFHPDMSILRAYVAWIKSEACQEPGTDHLTTLLNHALDYAWRSEKEDPVKTEILLDGLELSLRRMSMKGQVHFAMDPSKSVSQQAAQLFQEGVMKRLISGYVSRKLHAAPDYFDELEVPPLHFVLREIEAEHGKIAWSLDRIHVVRCLLEHGQDPNRPFTTMSGQEWTPWTRFLFMLAASLNQERKGRDFVGTVKSGILSLLLGHGADPNAPLKMPGASQTCAAWVYLFLTAFVVPPLVNHADSYFQVLNSMLLNGADAQELMRSQSPISGWSTCKLAWEEFSGLLHTMADSARPGAYVELHSRDRQFIGQIVLTLARWNPEGLPWAPVEPVIQKLFPERLARPILDAIHSRS